MMTMVMMMMMMMMMTSTPISKELFSALVVYLCDINVYEQGTEHCFIPVNF